MLKMSVKNYFKCFLVYKYPVQIVCKTKSITFMKLTLNTFRINFKRLFGRKYIICFAKIGEFIFEISE